MEDGSVWSPIRARNWLEKPLKTDEKRKKKSRNNVLALIGGKYFVFRSNLNEV